MRRLALLLTLAGCGGGAGEAGPGVKAAFTAHVTDVASLFAVSPLPALAGGVAFEGRSYMTVKPEYAGQLVPLYAPTDMTLFAAKRYIPEGAPADYLPDWALEFTAAGEATLQLGFAHVKQVVPAIQQVASSSTDGSSAPQPVKAPVHIAAGELFGHYIKGPSSLAWDFIVQDLAIENAFANPPRYRQTHSKLLHVICPFERFVEPLREQYLSLLAGLGTPPRGRIGCGTVAQDRPGTAAGVWFLDPAAASGTYGHPSRGAYGSPLSAFKGEDGVIYLANLANTTLRLDPSNPTVIDPQEVTGEHCYQQQQQGRPEGYVALSLASPTELHVAYSATSACPPAFPAAYETYYR